MRGQFVFDHFLSTILVAIATSVAGLIANVLARKQRELARGTADEAKALAEAIQHHEAERRATAAELLLAKLPDGMSPQDFLAKLENIAARLQLEPREGTSSAEPFEGLINAYHEQALSQAQVQFWFSVIAATAGFVWIIYAGSNVESENWITILKTLPGIAMDAVAFLFFRQAAETRDRSTQLYDRLRKDRQNTESISLVSSIEDLRTRSIVQAIIALHMSGIVAPQPDLSTIFGGGSKTAASKK